MQIDKNNWQIKIDEENKEEVMKYLGKDDLYSYHIGLYYGKCNSKTVHLNTSQIVACLIITTDQFRKYILGKEDRKIIGYKAPFDMYDGEIKMGTLFELNFGLNIYSYYIPNVKIYSLPKEIVEKYFDPVYEEEGKVIELHGYRITKDSIKLIGGEIEFKDELPKYTKVYKEAIKLYEDVLKAYEELNK